MTIESRDAVYWAIAGGRPRGCAARELIVGGAAALVAAGPERARGRERE